MATPETIVLLPGLDGTGDLFEPLLRVLPADVRTRVVRYPTDRALSYAELLGVVEGQVTEPSDLVLVAESFSGPLAVRCAVAHPGRVRAVVLCASFVRPPAPRWLGRLCRPALFRPAVPTFAVRRWMVGWDAPDPLVRAVRAAVGRVRPEVIAGRLREVLRVDCADALAACRAPVLYLAPTRDTLVGRASLEFIKRIRPDVDVRPVEGPHLLLQREPQAAWREIEAFFSRTGRSACMSSRDTPKDLWSVARGTRDPSG